MKYFIITIDTEGDDLWHYQRGLTVKTENSLYIPRFQELCEKYDFKPIWLTNYEMVCDQRYVDYIKPRMEKGLCEVGIHIHAWNNPPFYELNGSYSGTPYLIEYPMDIMRAKFKTTYDLIKEKFGKAPVSHRAGRWAMNKNYFKLLEEFDVEIDCSYTPSINWSKIPGETATGGSNYEKVLSNAHWINDVLEVPASVRTYHKFSGKSFKGRCRSIIKGKSYWLRPAINSFEEMVFLTRSIENELNIDYLEFMVHSSELMSGGSPYFQTENDIEDMYKSIEEFFKVVKSFDYKGITLQEYSKLKHNV